MKKIISLFLILALGLAFCACGSGGDDSTAPTTITDFGPHLHYVEENGGYAVIGVKDSALNATEITIPASYNGHAITRIKAYAFEDCTALTRVNLTLPETGSVYIETGAFSRCNTLTSLYIPFDAASDPDAKVGVASCEDGGYGFFEDASTYNRMTIYVPTEALGGISGSYFWASYIQKVKAQS